MEKKTVSYLNSKVWYRFLKVVFCILFFGCLLVFNADLINHGLKNVDNNQTKIYCKQGSKQTLTPNQIGITLYNSDSDSSGEFIDSGNKVFNACGAFINSHGTNSIYGGYSFIPSYETYTSLSNDVFTIVPVYSYTDFLTNLILENILILFIFEFVRRVFYYIALGSWRPKK